MVKVATHGWLRRKIEELRRFDSYGYPEAWFEKGYEHKDMIKLDANENYFIPKEFLHHILIEALENVDLRFYPIKEYREVACMLSNVLNVDEDMITFGSGSGQLIDDVLIGFARSGCRVVTIKPSFSLYKLRSRLIGAKFIEVSIKEDLSLDVEAVLKAAGRSGVIFIPSPNNPTGNQFGDEVLDIAERFHGLVVLDEAYVDFADRSFIEKVHEYGNLVILRTFSKSYGIAAARIGYMVSNKDVIEIMRSRIQRPYSVSAIALALARKVLEYRDKFRVYIEMLKRERERFTSDLRKIKELKVFDSKANFVMIGTKDDVGIDKILAEQGILIRKLGAIFNEGYYYRVTVGLPEMNDRLLSELRSILT